jgi:DNA processing protein
MASGIDHWAHTAALREKGGTIGVLGSGIDVTYPSANIKLYEEILSNGSIITEFLPGTGPLRQNFPARNRIISGMSMGVVVIEAPEKSGALITAEFALSQDREVFAVPGNIFNTESTGCNNLIKNGAKPATKVDDILEELGHLYNAGIYDCTKIHKKTSLNHSRLKNEELDLSRDSRIIYDIIGSKPVSIEEIASESKFETSKILQIITELEIKNVIIEKQLNSFVRTY